MSGFMQALPFVLEREGGYVDHPDDRGGATNQGVTQGAYDRWRERHGLQTRPVSEMTDDERDAVYHEDYWLEAQCDGWGWPLSLAVFDAAVNHGPPRAIKLLQEAAGASVDGVLGPETRAAVSQHDPRSLAHDMIWCRLDYYARIVRNDASQAAFIVGWTRRMRDLTREVAP